MFLWVYIGPLALWAFYPYTRNTIFRNKPRQWFFQGAPRILTQDCLVGLFAGTPESPLVHVFDSVSYCLLFTNLKHFGDEVKDERQNHASWKRLQCDLFWSGYLSPICTYFYQVLTTKLQGKQGKRLTRRPCKGDKFVIEVWGFEAKLIFVGLARIFVQHGHQLRLEGVTQVQKMSFN